MKSLKAMAIRISSAFLALCVTHASAAPGKIMDLPPYVSTAVPPNILFLIDDSYSMLHQVSIRNEARDKLQTMFNDLDYFINGSGYSGNYSLNYYEIDYDGTTWPSVMRNCPGINALAFNPEKTYTPWRKIPEADCVPDESTEIDECSYLPDAVYGTQTPRFGPYENTVDLTKHTYTLWIDEPSSIDSDGVAHGNGVFDWGECGSTFDEHGVVTGYDSDHVKNVADLPDPDTSTLENEALTNYANWYVYHRDRISLFKKVLSEIFYNLETRAAYATINTHADKGWAAPMKDVNDTDPSAPYFGDNRANKKLLMEALHNTLTLYKTEGQDGLTPLRRALENAGRYYSIDATNPSASIPADLTIQENFVTTSTPKSPVLDDAKGGSCQINATLLATDGYTRDQGIFRQPKGTVYGGESALADIAEYFFSNDLQPNLDNLMQDDGSELVQRMRTYTLSFGITGNLPGFPPWDDDSLSWPSGIDFSSGADPKSLDDLIHAAFVGGGDYMSAHDMDSLQKSIEDMINNISELSEGTGAAVSLNSSSLEQGNQIYQAQYDSEDWSGNLFKREYIEGVISASVAGSDAATKLKQKIENNQGRRIITYNGSSGIVFKYSELTDSQKSDLATNGPEEATALESHIKEVVAFIRGGDKDHSFDPDAFRFRSSFLGDIVNSSPVYVGTPSSGYPDLIEGGDASYFDFVKKHRTVTSDTETDIDTESTTDPRAPMVYVGANDGMLHGFDADTLDEVFAYIPNLVFSSENNEGLHYLAQKDYAHHPYVDATPTVADVYINDSWKTYLIGGLGAGGKGIYVLDITDPSAINTESSFTSVAVTEFTDETMGYSFSQPKIARLDDGEWVAIFGNGYNNDHDGKAYLYVLYLDGEGGPNNKQFEKIALPGSGSVASNSCLNSASDCNGLSTPVLLDLTGDGNLDRVYAGDLHGNMWAFDFTQKSGTAIEPKIAHEESGDKVPLFTACRNTATPSSDEGFCAIIDRQPITASPTVVAHNKERASATEPNLMVLFGTGQYLTDNDKHDTSEQAFYGVWDAGESNGGIYPENLDTIAISNNSDGTRVISGDPVDVNYTTNISVDDPTGFGWKMPLIDEKERVVVRPYVEGDAVLFVSVVPDGSACEGGGFGYLMGVSIFSGGKLPFDVLPDSPGAIGEKLDDIPTGGTGGDGTFIMPTANRDELEQRDIVTQFPRPGRRTSWSILK